MNVTNRPVVEVESGEVQGVVHGRVSAFRGIPYAASPVGALRFAPTCPHPNWGTPRDASRSGPSVPQNPSRLEAVMGKRPPDWNEEESLTLNVWVPRPPGGSDPGKLPVLVWFHGGGFTSGSGGWEWYDGRNLALAGDIVVVTANYRIGPLGYLYLPEWGVNNIGVQDQVAVLAWVRRNIAGFGGDPDDLTVGGQSAGAYSAAYLAAAPETGPLIRRVITQSGPLGMAPQSPEEAHEHARRFVEILGLADSPDPLAGLRAAPADWLLVAYRQLASELTRPGNLSAPMYPVSGGPGMPATWQQALSDGRLDGKDWLTGTTRNEMSAFFAFNPKIQSIDTAGACEIAAEQARDGAERYDRAAAQKPSAMPSQVLTDVVTEIRFRDGSLAIADHRSAADDATYVYQFDYDPPHDPAHLGSAHCVELPFFFDNIDAYADSPMLGGPTAKGRQLAHSFCAAVAAFVATGRPADDHWPLYVSGVPETVRHFR